MLEFSWIEDALLEGFAYSQASMTARPSEKIAPAEREGSDSLSRLKGEGTHSLAPLPCSGHDAYILELVT